jgi:hypothetical protein
MTPIANMRHVIADVEDESTGDVRNLHRIASNSELGERK